MPDLCLRTESLSDQERHGLILKHLPQVRLLARRIRGRLPESVSLDDLVSAGVIGLITAIDRFDPACNVQLRTYAEHKIRGAILDSLRRLDWAPRRHRTFARQMEDAIAVAQQRWQRRPTEEEIAAELNLTLDLYQQRRGMLNTLIREPLEPADSDDIGAVERALIASGNKECPSAGLEQRELRRALAAAISRLPEVHRKVVSMYYHDELRHPEIAKRIGVAEATVSNIRRGAIVKLRSRMAKLWPGGARRHSSSATPA